MTLNTNALKGLHRLIPGTQNVTYYVRAAGGSYGAGATVINVESRPITRDQQLAAGLSLNKRVREFILWSENLGSTVPKLKDKLDDADSVTWHVEHVSEELLEQRYRCLCVQAVS